MLGYYKKYLLVCLFFLLLSSQGLANHGTLRINPFNTNPINTAGRPTSSFATELREALDHELAQQGGEHHAPFVFSGGIHGESPTLASAVFATVAYVPERINQTGTAITYAAVANDVCWTIISADNDGITGWTRVGSGSTGAYYYQCEGDTTPNQPVLPPNAAWLMQITVTSSALATITDLRTMRQHGIDSVANYASLAAAIDEHNDTGDSQVTLAINQRIHVTTSTTVPANMALLFLGSGALDLDSGVTLTMARGSALLAPPTRQIFYGAGVMSFGDGTIDTMYTEWCGAVADGSTNSRAAIIACAGFAGVRVVEYLKGIYQLSGGSVEIPDGQIWRGQGESGQTIIRQGSANTNALLISGGGGVTLEDLEVRGGSGTGDGLVITDPSADDTVSTIILNRVRFRFAGRDGLSIGGGTNHTMYSVQMTNNGRHGFFCGATNVGAHSADQIRIYGIHATSNGTAGVGAGIQMGITGGAVSEYCQNVTTVLMMTTTAV